MCPLTCEGGGEKGQFSFHRGNLDRPAGPSQGGSEDQAGRSRPHWTSKRAVQSRQR